jgi:hypothetical protein
MLLYLHGGSRSHRSLDQSLRSVHSLFIALLFPLFLSHVAVQKLTRIPFQVFFELIFLQFSRLLQRCCKLVKRVRGLEGATNTNRKKDHTTHLSPTLKINSPHRKFLPALRIRRLQNPAQKAGPCSSQNLFFLVGLQIVHELFEDPV